MDIDEAFGDSQTSAVLEAWVTVRAYEHAPAFSGGVLDAWPALMADGLAACASEESAIRDFMRWKEQRDGPESPPSR